MRSIAQEEAPKGTGVKFGALILREVHIRHTSNMRGGSMRVVGRETEVDKDCSGVVKFKIFKGR